MRLRVYFDYLVALIALRTGQRRFAASRFGTVLAVRSDHIGALHYYGWTTAALGRYEESLAAYERLARVVPRSSQARTGCGTALQNLGRHDEAIAHFAAALELEPDDPLIQHNLGVSLAAIGRFQDALPIYTRLARQHPDHADAIGNLAATLGDLGHWKDAVEWGRRAMSLAPTANHASNLGIALFELGEYVEAESAFSIARRLEPGSELECRLASAIARQGRFGEAETILSAVVRDASATREVLLVAHDNLGWMYLERGNGPAALRAYDAALSLAPEDEHLHEGHRRARALIRAGRENRSTGEDSPGRS